MPFLGERGGGGGCSILNALNLENLEGKIQDCALLLFTELPCPFFVIPHALFSRISVGSEKSNLQQKYLSNMRRRSRVHGKNMSIR